MRTPAGAAATTATAVAVAARATIWGWGSVLDHLGGAVSGDGRPELVRQTGARPHIYNFAPVPSLAPLVPSSSMEVCLQGALVTRSLPSTITSWS